MLTSFRKSAIALATATLCLATAAQAGNHKILILDGGYFPELVHVQEGDNVYFTNSSGFAHSVVSTNGEWTSGELGIDERFQLKVRDIAELNFSGLDGAGEVALNLEGAPMTGALTFEAPPTE